jgi:NAD-dependent deacetylase
VGSSKLVILGFRNTSPNSVDFFMLKRLVVLTGSGISAESGIPTFRAEDGLWAGYKIEEVATPEAWQKKPEMVLDFYNKRRENAAAAKPNRAHQLLSGLAEKFDVQIITQNVDDLHERAGSKQILHLHGSLFESRSVKTGKVFPVKNNVIKLGECCPNGGQLRPNIVWFGEDVPLIQVAAEWVAQADIFLIVGTSLQVYPAAGLYRYCRYDALKFLIDPAVPAEVLGRKDFTIWPEKATTGVEKFCDHLAKLSGQTLK